MGERGHVSSHDDTVPTICQPEYEGPKPIVGDLPAAMEPFHLLRCVSRGTGPVEDRTGQETGRRAGAGLGMPTCIPILILVLVVSIHSPAMLDTHL